MGLKRSVVAADEVVDGPVRWRRTRIHICTVTCYLHPKTGIRSFNKVFIIILEGFFMDVADKGQ